jgi:hypothetical protein
MRYELRKYIVLSAEEFHSLDDFVEILYKLDIMTCHEYTKMIVDNEYVDIEGGFSNVHI